MLVDPDLKLLLHICTNVQDTHFVVAISVISYSVSYPLVSTCDKNGIWYAEPRRCRGEKFQVPVPLLAAFDQDEGPAENDNLAVGAHGGSNEQDELEARSYMGPIQGGKWLEVGE